VNPVKYLSGVIWFGRNIKYMYRHYLVKTKRLFNRVKKSDTLGWDLKPQSKLPNGVYYSFLKDLSSEETILSLLKNIWRKSDFIRYSMRTRT